MIAKCIGESTRPQRSCRNWARCPYRRLSSPSFYKCVRLCLSDKNSMTNGKRTFADRAVARIWLAAIPPRTTPGDTTDDKNANPVILTTTLLAALVIPAVAQDAGQVSLFDGKTLEGWEQKNGTAKYRVENGTIVGKTNEGSPNSFLCTKKNYGDFELTFEVKVDDELNSGVQIRSKSTERVQQGPSPWSASRDRHQRHSGIHVRRGTRHRLAQFGRSPRKPRSEKGVQERRMEQLSRQSGGQQDPDLGQ